MRRRHLPHPAGTINDHTQLLRAPPGARPDDDGTELLRELVRTDTSSYDAVLATITRLVTRAESKLERTGTVGVGIPGTISTGTGLVKNANTTVLNGHALDRDLGRLLGRDVRCMNDANCLALSEAVDGAGAGCRVGFGVILGTGCGAGIAIDGKPWVGLNTVAGEWGHNPLPWMTPAEFPDPAAGAARRSAPRRESRALASPPVMSEPPGEGSSVRRTAKQTVDLARSGDASTRAALERCADRLARAFGPLR